MVPNLLLDMSRSVIPLNIRPHLVPFLYQEFEGFEAQYLTRKVKAAKISTKTPFGKIIRLLCEKSEIPLKAKSFNAYLSIRNVENSDFFGSIYKYNSGQYSFLRLDERGVDLINEHLEDIFRLSLIAFVTGYVVKKEKGDVRAAVNFFLDMYNLREFGFSAPTLEQFYNRERRNSGRLVRMQKAVSNSVLNYS